MLTLEDLGENSIANLDARMLEIWRDHWNLCRGEPVRPRSRVLLKTELAWEYCAMTGAFVSELTASE